MRTIHAVLPGMIECGGGSIINVSSLASSIKGVPNRFAYDLTKTAVIGHTKAIAADCVGKGNVNRMYTLKRILMFERLRLRGPNGARDEFHLAAAQNLRKLANLIPTPAPRPA